MSKFKIEPTGVERRFGEEEIIVSKTDLNGKIAYVNDVFLNVSGFTEEEVMGQPHSMIRHPEMPRAVFKLLWDTIQSGNEIFAYVCNMCKNGDHYWVLAHVTPTKGSRGEILGFHSNRRVPERAAVAAAQDVYRALLAEERRHSDPRKGLEASYQLFTSLLEKAGKQYEEYIWTVGQ
jgi:PAS domain S-box-containing protein